ncbi:membrane progestin receptor beta-like [Oncorhynchus clarkii lewisi]|uniref:membrane progestin receptor beta-like n=2 Tax=Oncorhynchus TaxID=8016 RepID=UPI0039B89819
MHLIKFDQTQYDNTVTNLLSFPLQTDPLTSPQTSSQVPHSPYPLIPSAPNSTMPSISVSLSLKPMSSLSSFLSSLSSLPHTVRDTEVPLLFREPYILSGYRPVGHSWSFYFLSLFQIHNETINVWSHLLAGVCVALRFSVFAVMCGGGLVGLTLNGPDGLGLYLDLACLPLVYYVLSLLTYLCCSATAHLLQSHSELAHYALFFLDYVGVAVYQYGCALALYFYSSDPAWRRSRVGEVFLPAAALLAWLSCACCCFAKLSYRHPYPLHRKLCQVVPTGLAYLLDSSPVAHRLVSRTWGDDPAMTLHAIQVLLFLLAAFFFSCPMPERFFPGHCDIIGHGHQLFHFLLSLCTLTQQEAVFEDFLSRRASLTREYGECRLLVAAVSFPALVFCSVLTAVVMRRLVERRLRKEDSWGEEVERG